MGNFTIKLIEFRFHINKETFQEHRKKISFFIFIDAMANQDSNEKEDLSMHSSLLNSSDLAPTTTNDSHILSFGMSPGT